MVERAWSDPVTGKDQNRSPHRRIRVLRLQRPAVSSTVDLADGMEAVNQTRAKESVKKVQKKLKELWAKGQGTNVQVILGKLNPVIRGWANYFRTAVTKEIFKKLDRWMYTKADHYTRRMHPKKSRDWQH